MENYQKIDLYKRREFSEKLNITFAFIRQNAAPFFKAQLYISGPTAIVATLLYMLLMRGISNNEDILATGGFVFSGAYFLTMGFTMLIYFLLYLSILLVTFSYLRLYQESTDGKVSTNDVFQQVMQNLGMGALSMIMIYVIVVVSAFFLFFPAIYMGVVCSLVFPVMVMERASPMQALERAFKLIKGKWWSTFGLIVVTGIIAYIIMIVIAMPAYLAMGFSAFTSMGDGRGVLESNEYFTWAAVLASFLGYIGAIVGSSITQLALGFQYGNLVEMKESRGLLSEIEKVGTDDKPAHNEGEY